uniref:8 kDa Amblyomma family member n=1 Tax=Rhipicephalus appendiculatus TaxID=34631 RepID=A0A131YUI5_RHIAP
MAASRTLAFAFLATAAILMTQIVGAFSQVSPGGGPGPALQACSGSCHFKNGVRSGCTSPCTCSSHEHGLNVPDNYTGTGNCVQSF